MSAHTLQQQIDAVAREIGMREYVYPSRVANKKMKQEKADYEIAVMKSIAATLVGLHASEKVNPTAVVGGTVLGCSVNVFVGRVEQCLVDEQEKLNPDNALIGVLADSVRLAREHVAHMQVKAA